MTLRRLATWAAPLAAGAAGAGLWMSISAVTGYREAWDHPSYLRYGLPALALITLGLGCAAPRLAILSGIMVVIAQPIVLFASAGFGNLWPIAMGFFVLMTIPSVLIALAGAFLRSVVSRRPA